MNGPDRASYTTMPPRQAIVERGWALFPSVVGAAECRAVVAAMEDIWSGLGRPALYSRSDQRHGADIIVSAVGMVAHGLEGRLPRARELLLPPPVAAAVGDLLGPENRLELVSGALSDETRPFLLWHHHVGGIVDAREYRKQRVRYPRFERVERLACTFYPVPLDDDHGVMLVHPRRVTDPTEPPYPDLEAPWPVEEIVRCPAGSVLLADQSMWHAVTPMRVPGRRAFVAGFLVSGHEG
jgi:hypothetical protein